MCLFLHRQGLYSFIDGSDPYPLTHLQSTDGTDLQPKPSHLTLKQPDQLLISTLISSLLIDTIPLNIDCTISKEIWLTLEQALASPSNTKIVDLYVYLQQLCQGDDSVTTYLQKAKNYFDQLIATGRPISSFDFNLNNFRGLQSIMIVTNCSLFSPS